MKRIIMLFAAACICIAAVAKQPAMLTVRWADGFEPYDRTINIYIAENGEAVEAAGAVRAGDAFNITVERPWIYYIGQAPYLLYPVWLEGGERLTVELAEEGHRFTEASPKNAALAEWTRISRPAHNLIFRTRVDEPPFEVLFDALNRMAEDGDRFREALDTEDAWFDDRLRRATVHATDHYAIDYTTQGHRPGYISPTSKDYPAYYERIVAPGKFDDELALALPYGKRLLSGFMGFAYRESERWRDRTLMMELVGSPVLRDILLYSELQYTASAYELRSALEEYRRHLSPRSIAALEEKLARIVAANDRETQDFTFMDVDGNPVSLSDFAGRVVVVDVWATWCGPCMAQLPYLHTLEEKFRNESDVVFIGVSIDKPQDREKWAQMVRDGKVSGIQLFADRDEAFSSYYEIRGIPRFIVFGRDGRLVEFNAPRPSEPLLEKLINEELAKNTDL